MRVLLARFLPALRRELEHPVVVAQASDAKPHDTLGHETGTSQRLMLWAPLVRRRVIVKPCSAGSATTCCCYSNGGNLRRAGLDRLRPHVKPAPLRRNGRHHGRGKEERGQEPAESDDGGRKPSLIEQLFPEETKRYEQAQRKASREVPRLPLDSLLSAPEPPTERHVPARTEGESNQALRRRRHMQQRDEHSKETTVLVLRNASPNLTEDDFRRLVPQGQHLEGWTLEQSDILKVIPGRNLATLEHLGYYYLLFSSRLGAVTYQAQATRIARMAAAHTPSSMSSPIPPPPGYQIEGLDAHAAIESFALIPPSQNLELRQLSTPLSPMLEAIVKHRGYPALVNRANKSPYEVRLVLDGPQLQLNTIKHILHASGRDRALSWSGGDEIVPSITKWNPRPNTSPHDTTSLGALSLSAANKRTEEEQLQLDVQRLHQYAGMRGGSASNTLPRRSAPLVYILGFKTEGAARSFVAFWHRRAMTWEGANIWNEAEGDSPPVASVEML